MKNITINEVIEFVFGLDEDPDYGTPAYDIRDFEYDLVVSHKVADWINNEGLGCYRADEPEGDYDPNEKETITISAEEYISDEFKSDVLAHLYTEELEDGIISKEDLESWINSSLQNCVDFFNNFTITNPDEDEVLCLEIRKDIHYTLEMLNEEWTDKEFNVTGFDQLEDSPRIRMF